MSQLTYEASVYSRTVTYRNFKGVEQTAELTFALDPIQLMAAIASFNPKTSKSRNPAKQGQPEISDEEQIKFVQSLASKAAGFPSDDGESWEPFDNFENTIAGKAFLTQLVSSDKDRSEFAQQVILDPFRAFANFAEADKSNSPQDVANLRTMLTQLENVFSEGPPKDETLEERRARLEADLAALENNG